MSASSSMLQPAISQGSAKRFIADALSSLNLLCGVASIFAASQMRFDLSLMFLLIGILFDGLDGAAARRWGGTRIGVYADDVADGVNYGIAPGVALFFALGAGVEGAAIGIFFVLFTLSRLVFFTLNKDNADPRYFNGVPSPVGGLITLCAVLLFAQHTALMGLFVGIVCAMMVSYDVLYKHLGRALQRHANMLPTIAASALGLLIAGMVLWGVQGSAAVLLVAGLAYGFLPMFTRWRELAAPAAR